MDLNLDLSCEVLTVVTVKITVLTDIRPWSVIDIYYRFRETCCLHSQWSYSKQDNQCTFKVTLRRVRATIVAVEKQSVLHIPSVCL
jgi:hypothetical protein